MYIPTATKIFVPYADRLQVSFCGDSLTNGNQSTTTGGYRARLLSLIAATYNDFYPNVVGSDFNNTYSYGMIGASGMRSDQILNTYLIPELATIPCPTMPVAPDIVFLLAGTNDMLQGVAKSTWLGYEEDIIDAFRAANTNCHVFVGNLIDRDTYTATVADWNTSLLSTLQARSDWNTFVHHVDLYSAVGAYGATYYADQTHPNTAGYNLMANAWYTAYESIF